MKKLLWVEESLINEIQLLDEAEEIKQSELKGYIKKFKDEIESLGEDIDSNVLEVRAKAEKARETYKRVVEEEIELIGEMWCELDNKRYEAKSKLCDAKKSIDSISDDVKRLQQSIRDIDFYAINNVIEVIDKVSNMSERQLDIMEKLFKNKDI